MTAETRPTILIVDDTPANLKLLSQVLKDDYRTRIATNGPKALELARDTRPDLILLDVKMPDMDGYEVCRRLKAAPETREIPVLFVTAQIQVTEEARGFEVGAVDYIHKPISPPVVLARLRTHLQLRQAQAALADQNAALEAKVSERTREVAMARDVTVFALASLAEARDDETGNHIQRTQLYVRTLAETLRDHPAHYRTLDDATIELLFKSAPLHDIGKVGIPDHILLKPGRLTAEEFEIMKQHTTIGHDSLAAAEAKVGHRTDMLRIAREIAHCHHEKWDGSGYPNGLAGTDIPLSGRIMAVADVYDALISKRVYKPAFSHDQAVSIIVEGRGRHFDPDMVDAFLAVAHEFQAIARRFADETEEEVRQAACS